MTIPNVDNTTLNNLVPNLDVGDVADPELRLLAFQYIYAEMQVIVNELNNIPAGNIQDLSITSAKLANLAVVTGKIADLAVTTGKIADLAVTLAKMANNSVGTNQLVNAAVTAAKIMDGVLTAAKFVPEALTNETQNGLRITQLEAEVAQMDIDKADKTEINALATEKADKTYVANVIANIGSATPKGAFATPGDLETAFPSGDDGIYVVTADGNWYYWDGSAWTVGGVYQSTSLADEDIYTALDLPDSRYELVNALSNTAFDNTTDWNSSGTASLSAGSNTLTVASTTGGTAFLARSPSSLPCVSGHLVYYRALVETPDSDCTSIALRVYGTTSPVGNWYAAAVQNTPSANTEYEMRGIATIGSAITGDMYAYIRAIYADSTGKSFTVKRILFIDLTDIFGAGNEPSVTEMNAWVDANGWFETTAYYVATGVNDGKIVSALNGEFIMVDFKSYGKWYEKSMISLGDSITWQDGKPYGGVGDNAIGYQTVIMQTLGLAVNDNQGVSGRPMANGTSAGAGTVTTGKAQTYTSHDLVIIAAGTNDFRLSVPMGSLGQIGDTSFDDTTFYGAYRDLVEYILTQKPSIRIVLFTPLQRDNAGYDVNFTNSAGFKLIDYVNAVRQVGEMYSVPVCDMYAESSFTKKTLTLYTLDGLHPNDTGYARMGSYASSWLMSI